MAMAMMPGKAVRDNEHIFGQFLWTGTDYLGESNPWPSRGLGTGLLDFGSFLKPRGKFRASLWSETPVAYLGAYEIAEGHDPGYWIDAPEVWNFNDGQPVRVVCYTNCPSARLLVNGEPVATASSADLKEGMMAWDIPFKPGELKVEALAADGSVAATDKLQTTGRPYALRVTSDTDRLDESSPLAHVTVEVVDENGVRIPLADNMVKCEVESGVFLGLEGTGNTDMSHPRRNGASRIQRPRSCLCRPWRLGYTGEGQIHLTSAEISDYRVQRADERPDSRLITVPT